MPTIKCEALACLYNLEGYCSAHDQIDIARDGRCLDHTPLTDEEYETINGRAGSK